MPGSPFHNRSMFAPDGSRRDVASAVSAEPVLARARSILDLAHRVHDCQILLPGVCVSHSEHGCEPVHSNQGRHAKGGAQKASDAFHAAGCHACHVEIDTGRHFTAEAKARYWQSGFERTLSLYVRNRWLVAK